MKLHSEQQGDSATIKVEGNLDEAGAEELKKAFAAMDLEAVRKVTVDLAGVEVVGSSAIGKLLLFYKHLAHRGGTLVVRGLAPAIHDLFRELRLDTLFAISGR